MRKEVRLLEEKEHRQRMIDREQIDEKKRYGDDILARVRAYQKESSDKKLSKEESEAGAMKKVAEVREDRLNAKKDLLVSRTLKVDR